MNPLHKGLLIAIEGIDGSGKSTLAHNLFKKLQNNNYNALLTKEPGDSQLGKKIRELVQTHSVPMTCKAEYLLFAADRAQHFAEVIIPALQRNIIVISDRLADSSLAYQGYGRNLDLEYIHTVNKWAMENRMPDLTVFVQIPVTIALARVTRRNALSPFEKEEFLTKVAHGFEKLYKNRSNVILVDGTQSPESLVDQTYTVITQWISKNKLLS